MRLFVGHSLADHTLNRLGGAMRIGDFQCHPLVVPKVKLGKVTLQMLLRDVVIGSGDPALEDRKIALDRIRVRLAANVFTRAMVDRLMREVAVHVAVLASIVRHQERVLVDLRDQDRAQRRSGHVGNVMRANAPATLDQGKGNLFAHAADGASALARVLVLLLAADIRLVGFHRLAGAAKRRSRTKLAHTLADTVRHEPSRLVWKAKHPMQLVRAHALLAGAHQMRREKPLRHRNVRPLIDRADRCRELLPAILAVIPARPHRHAAQCCHAIKHATERAVRTIRPTDGFEVLPRLVCIGEDRVGEVYGRGHGLSP